MFCRLTYSCIQFIQRMVPPLSMNHQTKPIWLSLLYKKSGQMSTQIEDKVLGSQVSKGFSLCKVV